MKTPISTDLDFKTFKKVRNFQNKITKKSERNYFKIIKSFFEKNKKISLVSLGVLLVIIVFIYAVIYPAYVKNYVTKSNEVYLELQKKEDDNLKKTFDDILKIDVIKNDDLEKIKVKIDDFKKDIDDSCNKLPPAFFTLNDINSSLKKYCGDLKNSVGYVYELLQAEVMIGTTQNYYKGMSEATSKSSTFKEMNTQYLQLIKNTKEVALSQKYTNSNLVDLQKSTAVVIEKIKDAYDKLSSSVKLASDPGSSSSEEEAYKKSLSDIAKPWSESIPTYVDKVTNDVRTNTQISSQQFLTEYNKLSGLTVNKLKITDPNAGTNLDSILLNKK